MILVFVPFEPFPSVIAPKVWGALSYLGICGSVLGFVWYYEGVKKIGPVKTSVFNNLIPIFAMIISMVLLKETLQTYMIYGSILVIGGVLIINRF
jgi:drug/metabolite transporter (DMT)-like permease